MPLMVAARKYANVAAWSDYHTAVQRRAYSSVIKESHHKEASPSGGGRREGGGREGGGRGDQRQEHGGALVLKFSTAHVSTKAERRSFFPRSSQN